MPWRTAVEPVIQKILSASPVPGMVIAVMRGGGPAEFLAAGADAAGRALTAETLFSVASITKLATALTVLRLADSGALSLDAPLWQYLPEAASARDDVTLRALLSHTSGLPYDLPPGLAPYNSRLDWPTLAQACLQTPLTSPPHKHVLYSNVGPGLCAIAVERLTGRAFHTVLEEQVLAPLGIQGYLGVEPPRLPAAISFKPTSHTGTPLESYNSVFWRALAMPWGGLVTDPAGVLALGRAYAGLNPGFLSPSLLADALSDQTGGLGGGFFEPLWWPRSPWGLGVELRGGKTPHWTPPQASPDSFGHAGASGCLVWHDPAAQLTYAILGTRDFTDWWPHWPAIGEAILT
jgi:CubicO group peptidase (beta-lactamase class C family)